MVEREPGTYRTRAGTLIHFRRAPDGRTVLEIETAPPTTLGDGDELVKLSDDPNWPDIARRAPDPDLFAD